MEIKIHHENIELTEPIKAFAEERIGSLTKYMDSLLTADVWLGKTTNHHQKGDVFECKVNLVFPGEEMFRAEVVNEDLYNAISEAHDILRGQITKFKEKQREFKSDEETL